MNRNHLKNDNSEKEESEKGQGHLKKGESEKEDLKTHILKRIHLNKDNSEKDMSEKGQFKKRDSGNGQLRKD